MSFQTTGELSEWYKVMFSPPHPLTLFRNALQLPKTLLVIAFSLVEISYPSGSRYLSGCHPQARWLRNIHIFGTFVSQVIAALSGAYSYVQGIASNEARDSNKLHLPRCLPFHHLKFGESGTSKVDDLSQTFNLLAVRGPAKGETILFDIFDTDGEALGLMNPNLSLGQWMSIDYEGDNMVLFDGSSAKQEGNKLVVNREKTVVHNSDETWRRVATTTNLDQSPQKFKKRYASERMTNIVNQQEHPGNGGEKYSIPGTIGVDFLENGGEIEAYMEAAMATIHQKQGLVKRTISEVKAKDGEGIADGPLNVCQFCEVVPDSDFPHSTERNINVQSQMGQPPVQTSNVLSPSSLG
ncbi:hypothetical protein BU17DRAFT_67054 [Hysterangium stoloniferum]|nr:hypothetical protein BU17DRAFT_67054 [Hysterangium stoloniferum]